ncbi:hypothetical protein AS594_35230 [Streptomyces agglomeratus]|uniref:CHAT domain-containing protein n=1 Tax=Streptomyces agglomeratus TaxID=285458 RepID=A0A1E5PH59_9ACTN|nr:CHAT domain-containing protein [Streptomyces agglomeratus]OEJ28898.1 hypothetical protein AS594_35230 [Streptomyces agglomeratus]
MRDKDEVIRWVTAVLDGQASREEAVRFFQAVPGAAEAAFLEQRATQVLDLIARMNLESSVMRLLTMIELGERAASPIGPHLQTAVLLAGAQKLLILNVPHRAGSFFDQAVEYTDAFPRMHLLARRMRLDVLYEMERYEEFDQEVSAVVSDAERQGSTADLCMALLYKADAAARRGHAKTALETITAARPIRDLVDERDAQAMVSPAAFARRHGLIARQAGEFEEALAVLEDARALSLAAGDVAWAAYALSEIGITWEQIGEHTRGQSILHQAAVEAESAGHTDWARHWRHDLHNDAAGEGEPDLWHRASALIRHPERAAEAIPLLRACIAEARRLHEPSYEADARMGLALAYSRTDQPLQAELSIRAAIATARRHGDHLREILFRSHLARNLTSRDRLHEALAEVQPALELGEQLRKRTASTELRQSIGVALAEAYDVTVLAASVSYRPGRWMIAAGADPAGLEPRPDTLLLIGQRARAATMTEALRVGSAVEGHDDPALVRGMLRLRAAEAALQLAAAEYRPLAEPIAERNRSAAALTEQAARSGIRLTVSSNPVPPNELAAALTPGEALVDLLAVPEGIAFTCLTGEGRTTARLAPWPTEERQALLRRLQRTRREFLGTHPDDRDETANAAEQALAALDTALLSTIAELAGEVLTEPPTRMLVTPENELFHLPFWRLASLFPGCAVSVLPTPGALPLMRARPRDGRRPWVSVPDPSRTLRHTTYDLPANLRYQPCTPSAQCLIDTLSATGRVHFACHGHFNGVSPYRSGLEVLAGPEHDPLGAPRPGEGEALELFTAAQIAGRLHLPHCALVVLAACESGLPRLHAASEFTSLPGAFLIAGARNVVASLWPAHDGAAALLMHAFYEAYTTSPSAALATARARLAAMSRAEASARLGTTDLPYGDKPFGASIYTDCFQHYGVD